MKKEKKYTIIYLSVCIIFLIISIVLSIFKNNNIEDSQQEIVTSVSKQEYEEEIINTESTEVSNFEEVVNDETEEQTDEKEIEEDIETEDEFLEEDDVLEKNEVTSKETKKTDDQTYFKIIDATKSKNTIENLNTNKKQEISNTNKTNKIEKTERQRATESLRAFLTNEQWIEKNLLMETSCFQTELEYEQKLTFMLLKGGKDVIVQAMSEDDLSTQIFLVSYDNGGITVTPFSEFPSHCSHVNFSVDANNFIVEYTYVHMGNFETIIFEIGKEEFKKVKEIISYPDMNDISDSEFIYEIDGQNVTEFEYNTALKNEYNFNYIETELNDTNVNKYVK